MKFLFYIAYSLFLVYLCKKLFFSVENKKLIYSMRLRNLVEFTVIEYPLPLKVKFLVIYSLFALDFLFIMTNIYFLFIPISLGLLSLFKHLLLMKKEKKKSKIVKGKCNWEKTYHDDSRTFKIFTFHSDKGPAYRILDKNSWDYRFTTEEWYLHGRRFAEVRIE